VPALNTETIIRLLTIGALSGLLFTVGLRLTLAQVFEALRRCRFTLILVINFAVVPALALLLAKTMRLDQPLATGMILLASAPFAPVVPVFTRLAKADLALAAGLTSVVPMVSAALTPIACVLALKALPYTGPVRLSIPGILLTLALTIILPLGAGLLLKRFLPSASARMLNPIEKVSEIAGACSLAFVVATEFSSILETPWRALLAMVILSEVSLLIGYWAGSGSAGARQVVALGTSNRNIALALLVALENFAGTPVVPAVVVNGLLLILLGLAHVAFWRFGPRSFGAASIQTKG
jgi:BASS family bile acid:Na+ symporter